MFAFSDNKDMREKKRTMIKKRISKYLLACLLTLIIRRVSNNIKYNQTLTILLSVENPRAPFL